MKLSLALLGLTATQTLCTPTTVQPGRAAVQAECGALGVMEWNDLPENTDRTALRNCKKHPSELRIASPAYKPDEDAKNLESNNSTPNDSRQSRRNTGLETREYICDAGGRGQGPDYDYGCIKGWCWRNCNGPWLPDLYVVKKEWCWLAYEGGKGGWTPCGGWKDCEWSYNNRHAKCAKGNCKSCGCGC